MGIDSSYVAKVPTWQAAALASSVSMAEERCAMSCPGCAAQTRGGFRRQRQQYKIQFRGGEGAVLVYWVCSHCMQSVERAADATAAFFLGATGLRAVRADLSARVDLGAARHLSQRNPRWRGVG